MATQLGSGLLAHIAKTGSVMFIIGTDEGVGKVVV